MDTPRVKTAHSGRAGIHPKIRGCSFGTHCVHTCAHLDPRNTPRAFTLINSSFGTRWNPYFRTPPNSGRAGIHPKWGVCQNTRIRDATKYTPKHQNIQSHPFGTPCRDALHTNSHKKIFFHKNSHEHTTFHTHTHTECVSTLHSRAVPHRPSHTNIYIYTYIYIARTNQKKSIPTHTIIINLNERSTHTNVRHHHTQKKISSHTKKYFSTNFHKQKKFSPKTPKTLDFRRNSQKFINIQKHAYSHVIQKTRKNTIFRTPQNTPQT